MHFSNTPDFGKSGVLFLVLLLGLSHSKTLAQTSFNRWEAQPVATQKVGASAAQKETKVIRTKAQQDSLRIVTAAAQTPPLKRGIGQRVKEKQVVSEDIKYYEYVRKTVRYPIEAVRAGTEGRVAIQLTVDAAGQVVGTTVVENTISEGAAGREVMVQQAGRILQQLKFEPTAGVTVEELSVTYSYQ